MPSSATVWLADSRTVDGSWFLEHQNWLSAGESARYNRFMREERKHQFLAGRILLRYSLSSFLGVPPRSICVIEQQNLAPKLDGVDSNLSFSISHSGSWIACAVSDQIPLGLDIEILNDDRDLVGLSEQVFDAEDANKIACLQGAERTRGFYDAWSRKEACYKLGAEIDCALSLNYFAFPHPEISIVLCSTLPIQNAVIRNVSLQDIVAS